MSHLRPVDEMEYHPLTEELVAVLCQRTQNCSTEFFRLILGYYFAKVASMMRCNIQTLDRGIIPVNFYAVNLATSGFGKGHSINIIEEQLIEEFREEFLGRTFPLVAEENLAKLAAARAHRYQEDPDTELEKVTKEFERQGALLFSFDSGTAPAIKQMRHKLLMAGAGSMNSEIDEIGSNLLGSSDILNTFLELYDVGKIKQKLVKNTAESLRSEEIVGRTPCNLLMFGTPSKLLDGGKTEEDYFSFLDVGYGRRAFFGYSRQAAKSAAQTPEERLALLTAVCRSNVLEDASAQFKALADWAHFGKVLTVPQDVTLALLEYQMWCEARADQLGEYDEIRKAELKHRYFKTLKLAGAYAFCDMSGIITKPHLEAAIKVAEDSGKALNQTLARERPYAKLAKYIAEVGTEVTHADLVEDLPFFRGSDSAKKEMLRLATAWGYKNNIIIRKSYMEGIEFLQGESLKMTNLDEMIVAYSDHQAYNYQSELVPWKDIHVLTQAQGYHWVNHHITNGHRNEENAIPGFNMVVLDIDGECSLETAQTILAKYTYHMYTTKSHTSANHCFRIMIPTNYVLNLDADDFKEFMRNIFQWLPIGGADECTGQRARKWLSHAGQYFNNEGELLDVLPFIPKTSQNEERVRNLSDLSDLDNLERWFVDNTGLGNRSNQLIRYALLLMEMGADEPTIETKVKELNTKLPNKLSNEEINNTIMVTVAKRIAAAQKP